MEYLSLFSPLKLTIHFRSTNKKITVPRFAQGRIPMKKHAKNIFANMSRGGFDPQKGFN